MFQPGHRAMNFATNKAAPTKQKLRGGYYTPVLLANYLCEWALRSPKDRVLEPSAGDGNFVEALSGVAQRRKYRSRVQTTAVELDANELLRARKRMTAPKSSVKPDWVAGDFFAHFAKLKADGGFDVVLGNPPFIRFQHFDPVSRDIAFRELKRVGYRPTKLANVWCAFVQLSVELLRPGGRLAMVVPAELLQVKYAEQLRERITQSFDHVIVVTFRKLVFDGIQQEVVLLLAEGKRSVPGDHSIVHTLEFEDAAKLFELGSLKNAIAHAPEKHTRADVKWTALFLPEKSFADLLAVYDRKDVKRLRDFASVDVGVVTGRNSFFVLDNEKAAQLRINGYSVPSVGRTSSLRSISFSHRDLLAHSNKHPSILVNLNGVPEFDISPELLDYIKSAEREGVNAGYKCRIRRRWYDVPSIYVPDAFLFRQIHDAPLLVANEAGATSTDTIHRVRLRKKVCPQRLAAAFCNSLTFAWAEICGRSYGGGVLELEPNEAEELPVLFDQAEILDTKKLDKLLRSGGVEAALDYSDPILLGKGLGLKPKQIRLLRNCWLQLRDRRRYRKHVAAARAA